MSKIVVKDLYKIFGNRPDRAFELLEQGYSKEEVQKKTGLVVGVQQAEFSVEQGEIFVLMGLSGSGKSTLQRLLNRLIEPTKGTIEIDGTDIAKLSKQDLIDFRKEKFSGMVFQNFAILPHRTVLGNVEFGLELQHVEKETRQAKAAEVIKQVGLQGFEDHYPAQLSGGMQQRVGLARALAVEADVMLMDEAFSALDPLIRRDMQDELLELQSKLKKTIVFVTHDLDEAFKLGDRIAIMKDGKIVQIGEAEEIISEPADQYVREFVEGINRSEVLTAESIMQKPKETAKHGDGPKTILHKLKKQGLSSMFVLDQDRKLLGYVKAEELSDYVKGSEKADKKIPREVIHEAQTVNLEDNLSEVIDVSAATDQPIAVTDEEQRLKGIIVKGAIIAALSGSDSPQSNNEPHSEVEVS